MYTVSNQRVISVVKNQSGVHTILSLKALQRAVQELSSVGFKMWIYLAKNQSNYTLALSKEDALQWGVGSSSSYYRAVNELIDKGYLQKSDSRYIFYELPE